MSEKFLRLMYISEGSVALDARDLISLCAKFAANNSKLNLTGLLLRIGNCFVQVLEGDNQTVLDLVQTIIKDPRHRNFRVLDQRLVSTRAFNEWSMNFIDLDAEYALRLPMIRELREHVRMITEKPENTSESVVRLLLSLPKLIREKALVLS